MNTTRAVSIGFVVFAGCMFPPAGQGAGSTPATTASGPSSGGGGETAAPSNAPAPAPVPTSVELHNDCANTVPLFLGSGDGKPGFSGGTRTSIGSNTTSSFPRNPDGTVTIWIIDSSENGVTNLKVTPAITHVTVNCTTLSPG